VGHQRQFIERQGGQKERTNGHREKKALGRPRRRNHYHISEEKKVPMRMEKACHPERKRIYNLTNDTLAEKGGKKHGKKKGGAAL